MSKRAREILLSRKIHSTKSSSLKTLTLFRAKDIHGSVGVFCYVQRNGGKHYGGTEKENNTQTESR